jgi:uncharacterized protein (DUF697 family)/GTPase SAR1 family protein
MEKGNVLVIGNSGVGKSTLINAVLGDDAAETGWGTEGTTNSLKVYENDEVLFRIIDTVGFEPSFFKERAAINAVREWSKSRATNGIQGDEINAIWFCVEGTSSKLFPDAIDSLSKATSIWKSVPIIVVITKSYSVPDRQHNIEMVNTAFDKQKRCASRLKGIIPVVAETFALNDVSFAPPEGIGELIDETNAIMPEGIKAAEKDVASYVLQRKRHFAQGIVATAVASGVVVGAVPFPIPDAAILVPIETAEVTALATLYGINKGEDSRQFIDSILEVGTVSAVAKGAVVALKAIPAINLAASVLNAIIAGGIAGALGEGSVYAFEQVYLGEKSVTDVDWVKRIMEMALSSQSIDKTTEIIREVSSSSSKDVKQLITDLLVAAFKPQGSGAVE